LFRQIIGDVVIGHLGEIKNVQTQEKLLEKSGQRSGNTER